MEPTQKIIISDLDVSTNKLELSFERYGVATRMVTQCLQEMGKVVPSKPNVNTKIRQWRFPWQKKQDLK